MKSIYLVALSIIVLGTGNSAEAGQPAARLNDLVVCPAVTGIVPHVGGPIIAPVIFNVLIGGMPAATLGSLTAEVGPPATIVIGSSTVLIGGLPASRLGDLTSHGGVIVNGSPTVLIGG